ncbi:hypothetical protein IE81DRAFT_324745 [Ceraceosorus guamensis]|uniref:Histone chaperone domain-containing protein n=1 Tax=Ceraceosorus guamensis TaxID=1522189 RepID=A0A316VY78_9BASI|nr:hypothetical protein IE81DRAFT_324745 [Ceraceosorus guamensis]PWN41251.1 hypothetical protein IE81DRAFT_324745 [Ceraceosorus guamensis]
MYFCASRGKFETVNGKQVIKQKKDSAAPSKQVGGSEVGAAPAVKATSGSSGTKEAKQADGAGSESEELSEAEDREQSERSTDAEDLLDDDEISEKKRRRKSGGTSKDRSAMKKRRRSKGETPGTDKSSDKIAEVKRLQSYVLACGVRKQWKRVFEAEGCGGDNESDLARQCKVVRSILEELGMPGRLSMERAKKIREEREFKAELEALQGNADLSGTTRSGSKRGRAAKRAGSDGASDAEEDDGPKPAPRRKVSSMLADFAAELNDD